MTRSRKIKVSEALKIEARALELLDVFPPRSSSDFTRYTRDEYEGWSIHYWNEHGNKTDKLKAPEGEEQLAGWLARELYLAFWSNL